MKNNQDINIIQETTEDDADYEIQSKNLEEVIIETNNLPHPTKLYKKKNTIKKNILIVISIMFGLIILSLLAAGYYIDDTVKNWENYVYPGVSIDGIEYSKMTKDELAAKLSEEYLNPILKKYIIIKAEDKEYSLDFSELNPQYNIDEVVEGAFNYKKNDKLINKFLQITDLFSKKEKEDFQLKYSFNDAPIIEIANKIEAQVTKEPANATFKLENGAFIVTDDIKGAVLKKDELISKLTDIASNPKNENMNIEATLDIKVANVTGDLLRRINGVMSTFTTTDSDYVRLVNMGIGAKDLNGTLLLPGETFSFNDVVGDSLPEKGYLQSYAYINNESVLDYGGGICQLSTTLYGALLRANISPTERGPHMMPIWYVPMGLDAAVYYGVMDVKFKNEFDAPIYIESYLNDENLTVTLYGDTSLMKGLRYEPYSVEEGPLAANAYLQTIDGSGNVINEVFLHYDTYN